MTLAFIPETLMVSVDRLLPSRKIPDGLINSRKFQQIFSSIEDIGLIEPLSITAADKQSGTHTLLDGHLRLIALQKLQHTEVPCIIAKDDEAYTYNTRINRLSTIQEHYMICRAIERGVSPERLAKALNVDVSSINKKVRLLNGICPEAADLLKDRQFSNEIFHSMRKMKPARQIECAELMLSANNLSITYADALLAATPIALLVDGQKPKKMSGVSQEQMMRMEREMSSVQAQYKLVEQTYGQDMLNLVLARGYLGKLLGNETVSRYLKKCQPEVFAQFESIVATVSLDM